MADIIYKSLLDDKQVLAALKRIDQNIDKIASNGTKAFDGIQKSANVSGIQIGAIAGIVSSLTTQFIELGQRMVAALSQGIKESISLASSLETTGAIFVGILQGNEPAAIAALQHIREESRKLGIDLTETSRAFLPFVASLEELDRVNRISAALAISQPEQGQLGARIALQEALSGNVQSLVRRFEIPKQLGKELQRALDEGGVVEFLDVFEDIMKKLGRDVENLTDTFQFSFGRAVESGKQLQAAFGIPILDELKTQFNELNTVIAENFDDYTLIADTFGRVLANVVDIIGTGLNDALAGLDSEQLARIAEKFFDITEDVRLLIETMAGANFPESFIDGIETFANKLDQALVTATQLNLLSAAGAAKAEAEYQAWADEMERLHGEGTITAEVLKQVAGVPGVVQASNALAEFVGDEEAVALATKSLAAGQDAYNKVLTDGVAAIQESSERKEENREATDKLADAQRNATGASTDLTNAQLALNKAEADLATLTEDVAEAQAKVDEAKAAAAKDRARKFEDIDIAFERKKLDIIKEFADKRLDASRDSLRKIDDLRRHERQDEIAAALDLDRKEADIASKHARETIDLEADQRQKHVDIEKNFRQKLEDIDKQSSFDLEEAERNRDAVSFFRIIRQRGQQVDQARTDRQREVDELGITGTLRKAELKTQQDRELSDAQLANRRKVEDLRASLDLEIEDQNTAYRRQINDININEKRKNDEAKLARDRDRDDAKLAYTRKIADLQESLAAELALIAEFGAKKLALLAEIAAQESAIENQPRSRQKTVEGAENVASTRQGSINTQRQRATYAKSRQGGINTQRQVGRQFGGDVWPGGEFVVGEKRPELFVPDVPGRIMPNLNGIGTGQTVNNTNINLSIPADKLSPGQRAEARMLALEILDGVG